MSYSKSAVGNASHSMDFASSCDCTLRLHFAVQVGFVVGTDGVVPFLQQCMLEPSFVFGTLVVCFSAVQIMFELRAMEQRQKVPKATHLQAYALSHQVPASRVQQGVVKE